MPLQLQALGATRHRAPCLPADLLACFAALPIEYPGHGHAGLLYSSRHQPAAPAETWIEASTVQKSAGSVCGGEGFIAASSSWSLVSGLFLKETAEIFALLMRSHSHSGLAPIQLSSYSSPTLVDLKLEPSRKICL